MSQDEERNVIERCKQGDDAAFGELFEAHKRSIFWEAFKLLNSVEEAEDATQEVFLKAWKKIDQFRGESKILTWLKTITIRHCMSILRFRRQAVLPDVDLETLLGGDISSVDP